MKAPAWRGWSPLVTAFSIWFVHFMLCWTAVEIWPQQWLANALAWVFTAVALLAIGVHFMHLNARHGRGELALWSHRFGLGATALATIAVLFTALPAVVIRP